MTRSNPSLFTELYLYDYLISMFPSSTGGGGAGELSEIDQALGAILVSAMTAASPKAAAESSSSPTNQRRSSEAKIPPEADDSRNNSLTSRNKMYSVDSFLWSLNGHLKDYKTREEKERQTRVSALLDDLLLEREKQWWA